VSNVHAAEISRQEQRCCGFVANNDAFCKSLEYVGFNVRKSWRGKYVGEAIMA